MSACAWCLRWSGRDDGCKFPNSDTCRSERRLEDLAHAINTQLGGGANNQQETPA